ncbi:YhgE/Pip domain-containing protein [Microbacterium aquimaris]|uniref:YhgE/Pip domain-containing protein n=1 Tax=Microbacterium aquimaris TaxID=459816 RepID=UPI002AD4A9A1|nr:YhgE/Pip domain-containing protein [Microbacterium aquimaris]MDZ8276805.1 YhgE/Pip domain-containing protein [Microbacterium aquimaris]
MTLPIERARTRRPVTWLTVIGALLLPVVIGAILVAAFYDPAERLDGVTAAIVNDDDPVTIDDQLVPLGRQLTAGLVEGSDELPSNLDWTITNDDDAASGLADGTYTAVVTIPSNFSAAATSTTGDDPERAVIEVTTAPDNLVVDDAITAQITSAAASVMGQELSEVYLENVFLGFTTLGDQLGEAAGGADELADGADQLADGTSQYVDGIGELASGTQPLATGAAALAPGIDEIASGASALSAGGYEAADGIDELAGGAAALSTGASDLARGLSSLADLTAQIPTIPQGVIDAADRVAANSGEIEQVVTGSAAALTALADQCRATGDTGQICTEIIVLADDANAALPTITEILDDSDEIAAGLAQFQDAGPQLTAALEASAAGADEIAAGIGGIAGGATEAATGVRDIAGGTAALGTGAAEAATGAAQLADGMQQVAAGAQATADGGTELVSGSQQTADGAGELAAGLQSAVDEIPTYTDDEARTLASVVADPVEADGIGTDLFGATAIPLLAALALWIGGLGTFVALQAVTARALTSRSASALLAVRALAPGAAIGAAQGLLVAGVVQVAAGYEVGEWSVFAGMCVIAGVAFAAVNQALVAVFGGAGRWIAALVAVLTVAAGIVSTVPGWLGSLAAAMPTAPAYNGMVAALTGQGSAGAALVGLSVWAALSVLATVIAVARHRSAPAVASATPA